MNRLILKPCLILCAAAIITTSISATSDNPTSRFVPADATQPTNPWKITAIDFALPGYGTYVQNRTGFAAFYFSTNLVNLGLIYVAYRNWRFYESAYAAANLRQASAQDPLQFENPAGGGDYLSLQDIKNRAERGQLIFAISIVANLVLRGFSAWHTWSLADEARVHSGPRYEFYPEANGGMRTAGSYNFYF
jgi:hypothetical protein